MLTISIATQVSRNMIIVSTNGLFLNVSFTLSRKVKFLSRLALEFSLQPKKTISGGNIISSPKTAPITV